MKYINLLLILLLPILSSAQGVSGGVRIGLNLNSFSGPSEVDATGNELETFDNNTGFLVGGMINVGITDLFGVRAELQFSQKGGRKLFDGESRTIFNPDSGNEIQVRGNRKTVIRVNNSYIDIPVMACIRSVDKLQLFGGVTVGFLVASTGFGQLDIDGESTVGQVPVKFTTTLDHNYLRDEGYTSTDIGEFTTFSADGNMVQIPTEAGAYVLDFAEKQSNAYNGLDFGLIGGLSYKINGSLFLAAMYNFGLMDVTDNDNDVSRTDSDGNNRIFRSDNDQNRSLQLSLGFLF